MKIIYVGKQECDAAPWLELSLRRHFRQPQDWSMSLNPGNNSKENKTSVYFEILSQTRNSSRERASMIRFQIIDRFLKIGSRNQVSKCPGWVLG